MLSFIIDENLPRSLAQLLRNEGHEARHVLDLTPHGSSDATIYALAQETQSIVVSRDLEFGNVVLYPPGTHCGVVVVRYPSKVGIETLLANVTAAICSLKETEIRTSLVILEPSRIRIRSGGQSIG